MPKKKRRYLIVFGEANANDRKYSKDSFADSFKHKDTYMVMMGPPEGFDVSLGSVMGFCKMDHDDTGVYMYGFKFAKQPDPTIKEEFLNVKSDELMVDPPPPVLTQNAKAVLNMYRQGMIWPVTAGSGSLSEDRVVTNYKIHSVFFTSEPSFKPVIK